MAGKSIAQIAQALGAQAYGDVDLRLSGLAEPKSATATELALAMDPRFVGALQNSKARAAILADGTDWASLGLDAAILVARPRVAMAGVTKYFADPAAKRDSIHPSAVIDPSATIQAGAFIGPNVVIDEGCEIGPNARIQAGTWIGAGSTIGANANIMANVSVCAGARIGANFVAHPGVVIGGDGFSFVTEQKSAVEHVRETLGTNTEQAQDQTLIKIHSLGGVDIGDDVEIGANSSVDAGTIRPTFVGEGTKIDALVQVGHNVVIGRNCLLCAHVAVGGSATVGDNSVLGGQVGVADNIRVGKGVVAGGATKILSHVPDGRPVLGYPAMKMEKQVEVYKALRRLPKLMARVAGLESNSNHDKDD